MTELTIDDTLAGLLASVKGETTLLDKSGKVLGRYFPQIDQAAMHAKYGHLWTPEDLARAEEARKETGGQTLREIWKEIRREHG